MLEDYHQDEFGVLHQTTWKSKVYDQKYLSYYEGLHERTIKLGYQRLGWVLGQYRRLPGSLLEVGYGMGTFLEAAALAGVPLCAGYDVVHYPLPASCMFVDWEQALARSWDLTVLFDVVEHIPDLSFLGRLRTASLALSVPYCRWRELGDAWFKGWRMRLPDDYASPSRSLALHQNGDFNQAIPMLPKTNTNQNQIKPSNHDHRKNCDRSLVSASDAYPPPVRGLPGSACPSQTRA